MKDKIRDIVKEELKRYKICEDKELSSTFASLIAHKIIEITRLDEEKVADIIESFDGNSIIFTSYDDEPSITKNGIKRISKKLCSQQDELTKE